MNERVYTVEWMRTPIDESDDSDLGPYTCTGLRDRDIVRRIIGAIETNGPVKIIRIIPERRT